ncbi:MAG: hypothetical protein L6R41_004361 [Letrouitia leprolyta]|nr:MAG: hypothetical protein L6R41_004361 [Letrouitia leprolyta]
MSKPPQLKRCPPALDAGQPATTLRKGNPEIRGSSNPHVGTSIPPATGKSSRIQISQAAPGYRRYVSANDIGATTRSSNRVPSTTNDKTLRSQTIKKTGFPGSKPISHQHEISEQSLLENKGSKDFNLPQRKPSQQPTKSISSHSPSERNVPEDDIALSEDVRHIQRKLLQLHVLYSASAEIHLQWRESAKVHFQKRFGDLLERHVEIADIGYQTQGLKNEAALIEVYRNVKPAEIERRVRILSRCIEEIYGNLNVGGKYHKVIDSFEAWFAQAHSMRESRESGKPIHAGNKSYVEGIGAGWQNDVDALQKSLSTLTGDLRTLGSAPVSSNLGQLLILLQDLVIDMLAEVDCIRSVECELMNQEEMWIEAQIENLRDKVHNGIGSNRESPGKRNARQIQ